MKVISCDHEFVMQCPQCTERVIECITVAAVVIVVGCHTEPPTAPPVPVTSFYGSLPSVMAQMEHADIQKDVAAALRRDDRRPLGVMGIGLVVPGIDHETLAALQTEAEVIPHTSDNVYSAPLMEYQDIAYRYAERYNRVLLTKIPHLQTRPAK